MFRDSEQALDSIFSKYGMDRTETDRGIEYVGHNRPTDFAYFGKINKNNSL